MLLLLEVLSFGGNFFEISWIVHQSCDKFNRAVFFPKYQLFAVLARRSTSFLAWVSIAQRSIFALFQFYFMRRWKESVLFRRLLFLYLLYRVQDSDISTLVIKSAARHMLSACDLLHQLRMTRKYVPSRVQSLNPGFDFFSSTGTSGFFIGPLKTSFNKSDMIGMFGRSRNFMGSRHVNI